MLDVSFSVLTIRRPILLCDKSYIIFHCVIVFCITIVSLCPTLICVNKHLYVVR